jgi:hypothetical protein
MELIDLILSSFCKAIIADLNSSESGYFFSDQGTHLTLPAISQSIEHQIRSLFKGKFQATFRTSLFDYQTETFDQQIEKEY